MRASAVTPGNHPHAALWGATVAVALHALAACGLALVPARGWQGEGAVAVEIHEPPPPAPLPPPPEPPPSPPERAASQRRPPPRSLPLPPMPNQEAKPAPTSEEPATAVFGVTQDSVVTGESPVAVPVGNTLMTKERTLAKVPPPPLPAAPPPPAFDPVDEDAVAEFPEAFVKPEPNYPELAQRMGIGGKVRLKLGIDHKGDVKSVRVLEKAGYGMDEEAVRVIWQYKFKPAKRADGRPVDFVITYNFTFRQPAQ
jgi:periplasmic protein TonB